MSMLRFELVIHVSNCTTSPSSPIHAVQVSAGPAGGCARVSDCSAGRHAREQPAWVESKTLAGARPHVLHLSDLWRPHPQPGTHFPMYLLTQEARAASSCHAGLVCPALGRCRASQRRSAGFMRGLVTEPTCVTRCPAAVDTGAALYAGEVHGLRFREQHVRPDPGHQPGDQPGRQRGEGAAAVHGGRGPRWRQQIPMPQAETLRAGRQAHHDRGESRLSHTSVVCEVGCVGFRAKIGVCNRLGHGLA